MINFYCLYYKQDLHIRGFFTQFSMPEWPGQNDELAYISISKEEYEKYTSNQYVRLLKGPNGPFLTLTDDEAHQASLVIDKRNQLLMSFDFTIFPDSRLSSEARSDIERCRQELFDISEQPGFPNDVVFPVRKVTA